MSGVEGVIKYQLDFQNNSTLTWLGFEGLNAWPGMMAMGYGLRGSY